MAEAEKRTGGSRLGEKKATAELRGRRTGIACLGMDTKSLEKTKAVKNMEKWIEWSESRLQ